MLTVMVLCAVGVLVLFCREAFSDLRDAWSHPDHRMTENDSYAAKPKWK